MVLSCQALLIYVNGNSAYGPVFTDLRSLQGMVGGDIECVRFGRYHAYVNAVGKLRGLEVNRRATLLALELGLTADDVLVGDVVFLGEGAGGCEGDLPAEVVTTYMRLIGSD